MKKLGANPYRSQNMVKLELAEKWPNSGNFYATRMPCSPLKLTEILVESFRGPLRAQKVEKIGGQPLPKSDYNQTGVI